MSTINTAARQAAQATIRSQRNPVGIQEAFSELSQHVQHARQEQPTDQAVAATDLLNLASQDLSVLQGEPEMFAEHRAWSRAYSWAQVMSQLPESLNPVSVKETVQNLASQMAPEAENVNEWDYLNVVTLAGATLAARFATAASLDALRSLDTESDPEITSKPRRPARTDHSNSISDLSGEVDRHLSNTYGGAFAQTVQRNHPGLIHQADVDSYGGAFAATLANRRAGR